jgi:hypothetical protein
MTTGTDRSLGTAARQLVDRASQAPAADGQPHEGSRAVGQRADEVGGDRLDVPAGAQARRRELRLVQFAE